MINSSQTRPKVSVSTVREIASNYNIKLEEEDEEHYCLLQESLDVDAAQIASLPDYVPPELLPDPATVPRNFWKEPNNPLNAWSHRTAITSPSPSSQVLAGVEVAIKDNVSIGGLPLTVGTFPELLTGEAEYPISRVDSVVVSRILQAGGIIAGSATCEQLSIGPLSHTSASGPVDNPWRKGYTAGGSSSGPGALVGITQIRSWRRRKGLPTDHDDFGPGVPMAIGCDQGGSIRIPAAYNGIYGLKPTRGLVPYSGILGLIPMLDHAGPMCTSLEDVATLLGVIAGWDVIDPRMTPDSPKREDVEDYSKSLADFVAEKKSKDEWTDEKAISGLRVGLIKEAFEVAGLTDEVKVAVRDAAERFKAIGATVEEVSIPLHSLAPSIWALSTRIGIATQGYQNHPSTILDVPIPGINIPPLTQQASDILTKYNPPALFVHLSATYLQQYHAADLPSKALMHIHELQRAYDDALVKYDVLVTPVNPNAGSPHPTNESNVLDKMVLTIGSISNLCSFNMTGHPALSMPIGFGTSTDGKYKLPVGMQLIGKKFDEGTILRVAAAWEVPGLGLDSFDPF